MQNARRDFQGTCANIIRDLQGKRWPEGEYIVIQNVAL
jgi:hypothetical protein